MGVIFGWLSRRKLAEKLRFYVAQKKSGLRYETIAVKLLMLHGKTLQDYSLPTPTPVLSGQGYILVDQEQSKYDAVTQGQLRDQLAPKLNQEQKSI